MSVFWDPSADEQASWRRQRRQSNEGFSQAIAGIDLQRTQAAQKYGSDKGKLTREFDDMRMRLPGGFAKRGMLNSGLYGRGLQDYGKARTQGFGDLDQALNQQFAQLAQQQAAATQTWAGQGTDAAEAEYLRRLELNKEMNLFKFFQGLGGGR